MSGRAKMLLRIAGSLAAILLIAWFLDPAEIWASLRLVDPVWFGLALGALSAQIVLSAVRWRITANALGLGLTLARAISEYHLAVLGNTVLPGGILGDVGRIARARHAAGLGLAATSVILERLAGQIALALVALAGAVIWFWPQGPALWLVLAATAIIAAGAVLLRRGLLPLPDNVTQHVDTAWLKDDVWRAQLVLSALIVACNLFGVWAAAISVGVHLAPLDALFVIPLTLLAMLIPLSINGWGLREGAAAVLWPMAGVSAAASVAASVSFGLAALGAVLLGSAILWLGAWRRA